MLLCFHHRPVVNVLRLIWVLFIVFYEYGIFLASVRNCDWPDVRLLHSHHSQRNDGSLTQDSRPYHVLLVADPQIVDRHSYPNRISSISYLTRVMVDLNMRKSWQVALLKKPDAVVFLGDVMDNGRLDISDEEYGFLFERFLGIFKFKDKIPVYHIPGNHDIGLGKVRTFKQSSRAFERYVAHFGAPNHEVSVANHTLVLFDAPRFADEDSKRHGQRKSIERWTPIPGGSYAFVKNFAKLEHPNPIVLFSHIPMYRPDGKSCGHLREQGTIRPGAGEGYQNTLEKQSTRKLLEIFNPVAIFSGDDHDYCEYFHAAEAADGGIRTIREVSIRSISMVMNVRQPGFQLLSLVPSELRQDGKPTYADRPCLLPDQMKIYLDRYLLFIAISCLAVFISNVRGLRCPLSEGNPRQVLLSANINRDSEDIDEGSHPSPQSPPLSSTRSSYSKKSAHRALRGRGWTMFEALATRREVEDTSLLSKLSFLPWTHPLASNPSPPTHRRRRLWYRCLRDVRDIAAVPIVVFLLMTWWVIKG